MWFIVCCCVYTFYDDEVFFAYAVKKIKQNERFFTVEFTREIFRMQEGKSERGELHRKIVSN